MDYILEIFGGGLCYCLLVLLLLGAQVVLAATSDRVSVGLRMALWAFPQLLVIATWVVWTHTAAANFFDDTMLYGVPSVMAVVIVVGCGLIKVLSGIRKRQVP